VLTIKGEKQSELDEEQDGLRHTERSFGSFQRAVRLPKEVDAEGISAGMTNGVLTVRIPKAAKAERKLITIN
jgi:HSP20 family protein